MPEKYLSVGSRTQTKKIIEKSKFITTSCHVENEEQARAFVSEIAKTYHDATHNCYAYIADDSGNFLRFSDDGEPQGTAGMPMLEVLKSKSLRQTAVVVTRYFGGIKLGAGGLLRAYSGCVAENLDEAQKVLYEPCIELKITVSYSFVDAVLRYIQERKADLLNTKYLNDANFTVAIKKSEEEEFSLSLVNHLNGNVAIERLKEYFFPFKI